MEDFKRGVTAFGVYVLAPVLSVAVAFGVGLERGHEMASR
jgi:hypothetical protein